MKSCKIDGSEAFFAADDKEVLGYAVWFTISEMLVPWKIANQALTESGLPPKFKSPDPHDVFDRICTKNKEKIVEDNEEKRVCIMLREVHENSKKLVVETLWKRSKKIEYTEHAEILLVGSELKINNYAPDQKTDQFLKELVKQWNIEKECITDDLIRKMLIKILEASGKIKLKPSGSIYFVPASHFEKVAKFSSFLEWLKANGYGKRTEIWYAPIVNTNRFREMLKLKINDTIQEEFEKMFEMVFTKNGNPDLKTMLNVKYSFERIQKIIQIYSEILGEEMLKVNKLAEVVKRVLECKNIEDACKALDESVGAEELRERLEKLKKALVAT